MLLSKPEYAKMVRTFEQCMENTFGSDIKIKGKYPGFEYRGSFSLFYQYLPDNIELWIDNEEVTFNILITDEEKAGIQLSYLCKLKNTLNEKNIEDAVKLLKVILEEKEYDLLFMKGKEYYKKNSRGIEKIGRLKEFITAIDTLRETSKYNKYITD